MWGKANLVLPSTRDVVWYKDHTGWSWIFDFHGLFWLLLVILAVVALVLLIRGLARGGSSTETTSAPRSEAARESAMAILEVRYARGTIELEEYLLKKQVLS